jgi:hypothetical protein
MDVGFAFFLIGAEIMGQKDGTQMAAQLVERGITDKKLILYWYEECGQDIAVLRAKLAQPIEKEGVLWKS